MEINHSEPSALDGEASGEVELMEDEKHSEANLIAKTLVENIVNSISTHPRVTKARKSKQPIPMPKLYQCKKCNHPYSQFKSLKSHEKKCKGLISARLFIC